MEWIHNEVNGSQNRPDGHDMKLILPYMDELGINNKMWLSQH